MANLMFKTKGMVNPKGKPRVYFTYDLSTLQDAQ